MLPPTSRARLPDELYCGGQSGDVAEVIETLELVGGRELVVRRASGDDVNAVRALYGRLSNEDLNRRFFHAHLPPAGTTTQWVTVGERGGLSLVVEVTEADGTNRLVAEAGYALLESGDGELGITVDPQWRGWLGPWLLDVLVEQAAINNVDNLHADVLLSNRTMRALLEHRGYAAVDHPDWQQIRLVIGTHARTPGWAPHSEQPHLLVVSGGARWSGESTAQEAGFDVRTCPGPAQAVSCPLMAGERCPLVDGASAIIFDLPIDRATGVDLQENLEQTAVPVIYAREIDGGSPSPCERARRALDQVMAALPT